LQAIIDAASESIAVVDGDGVIVLVNETWRRFAVDNGPEAGQPARHTEVGSNYLAVCQASAQSRSDDSQPALEGIRAVLDGRLPSFSLEYPCHSPDQQRWFSMRVTPLGEGWRGAVIFHIDITKNRQTETSLRLSADRLNEAQRMAHLGSWTLDLVSGELLWSDEVFRLFEIERGRFAANYQAFLNAIHPDDRAAVDRAYTDSLVTRSPYEITHRLLMGDGRVKWVIERCVSDFDADGKPWRSQGTVQDVTERKLLIRP
jgi:PAS domain-containing protein